jgi:hypothetical protein
MGVKVAVPGREMWDGNEIIPEGEIRLASYEWRAVDEAVARGVERAKTPITRSILGVEGLSVDFSYIEKVVYDIGSGFVKVEDIRVPEVRAEFRAYRNDKLDLNAAECAGGRVAEAVEKLVLGVEPPPECFDLWTGPHTFRQRLVHDVVRPDSLGWEPVHSLKDVLVMLDSMRKRFQYGPFLLWHGRDWNQYMNNDYYPNKNQPAVMPGMTLRDRIRQIEGVVNVVGTPWLPKFDILVVHAVSTFFRLIIRQRPVVSVGRARDGILKVTAQMAVQIRLDGENSPILHAR